MVLALAQMDRLPTADDSRHICIDGVLRETQSDPYLRTSPKVRDRPDAFSII